MPDIPTLDNLLSQTDDATIKRLILDAYRLGVRTAVRDARELNPQGVLYIDEFKPVSKELWDKLADVRGAYHPITGEYIEGTKPSPHPDVIKVMLANMGVEDDGA